MNTTVDAAKMPVAMNPAVAAVARPSALLQIFVISPFLTPPETGVRASSHRSWSVYGLMSLVPLLSVSLSVAAWIRSFFSLPPGRIAMYVPIATPSDTTVSAAEAARPAFFHFGASYLPHTSLLSAGFGCSSTVGGGATTGSAFASGPSTCVTRSFAVACTAASLSASAPSSVFTVCVTDEVATSITLSASV